MTIVHLAGITPNGLTATRMVCGCLTKVKLHEAFKSMMPAHMINKNVEAHGCVFQWIHKTIYALFGCMCILLNQRVGVEWNGI
jgi:F-box/leucine-rich repeat protein 2/20